MVTKRQFMSLTKFINIFVSRLPPRPSIEIALTKPYRIEVGADDLFFSFLGNYFHGVENGVVSPRLGTRAQEFAFGRLWQNRNYEALSNNPGLEQAVFFNSFRNPNANASIFP